MLYLSEKPREIVLKQAIEFLKTKGLGAKIIDLRGFAIESTHLEKKKYKPKTKYINTEFMRVLLFLLQF